mgnify:CR=1 FL=1
MNQSEVAYAAREAGLDMTSEDRIAAVVRFAALVTAHEREGCAKVCELLEFYTPMECAAAIRERGETK